MDGKATTALPARAQAAAGAHSRRVDRVLVRASPDVAVRVWGGHVRAGARRGVQFVERAGAGAVTAGLFTLTLMAMYGNHRLRAAIGGGLAPCGSGAGWAAAVDRRGGRAAGCTGPYVAGSSSLGGG
jgi:hypothetical protein